MHFCAVNHFNQDIWKLVCELRVRSVCACARLGGGLLLLIDRHEEEVFGENVHVARPRLHPLVARVTIAEEVST